MVHSDTQSATESLCMLRRNAIVTFVHSLKQENESLE